MKKATVRFGSLACAAGLVFVLSACSSDESGQSKDEACDIVSTEFKTIEADMDSMKEEISSGEKKLSEVLDPIVVKLNELSKKVSHEEVSEELTGFTTELNEFSKLSADFDLEALSIEDEKSFAEFTEFTEKIGAQSESLAESGENLNTVCSAQSSA